MLTKKARPADRVSEHKINQTWQQWHNKVTANETAQSYMADSNLIYRGLRDLSALWRSVRLHLQPLMYIGPEGIENKSVNGKTMTPVINSPPNSCGIRY